MKLKLSKVVEAQPALARLGSEKLPVKISYIVQRNIQQMEPELKTYEKVRTDLIRNKYGEKGDDESYQVAAKNMEKFMGEIGSMLEVEIELDLWQVKLSEYPQDITPLDLFALNWMFEYDLSSNGNTPHVNGRKRKR